MGLMGYMRLLILIIKNGVRDIKSWKQFKFDIVKLLDVKLPIWYSVFMLIDFDDVYLILDDESRFELDASPLNFDGVFSEYSSCSSKKFDWLSKKKIVPLCNDNGGGDYYYYDFLNDNVIQIFHDTDNEFRVVNSSYKKFLKNLKIFNFD